MKLTIDSTPLKRALSRAAGIIATRNTVPILDSILLKADNDALTVEATDLEISVVETLAAKVALPGGFCVGGKALADIMAGFPAADVEIDLAENGRMRMKSGTYKASLPTLDAKDFPLVRASKLPVRFTIGVEVLRSVIKKISFAQSDDVSRAWLKGIYMHVTADPERQLCFAATDGMLLAVSRQAMPDGAATMSEMILPASSAAQIAKIIADTEGDISIGASESLLELQVGTVTFSTKLVSGQFPEYKRLIPAGYKSRLRLMRKPLVEALGLVSALQGKAVKLAVSETEVTISGTKQEQGEASVTLVSGQMELEGESIEIGVWLRNMKNIASATEGDVELLMTDPLGPLVLAHCDDPSVKYVTMPYRI
jgi:DNA polymerase-3 subunit beta